MLMLEKLILLCWLTVFFHRRNTSVYWVVTNAYTGKTDLGMLVDIASS